MNPNEENHPWWLVIGTHGSVVISKSDKLDSDALLPALPGSTHDNNVYTLSSSTLPSGISRLIALSNLAQYMMYDTKNRNYYFDHFKRMIHPVESGAGIGGGCAGVPCSPSLIPEYVISEFNRLDEHMLRHFLHRPSSHELGPKGSREEKALADVERMAQLREELGLTWKEHDSCILNKKFSPGGDFNKIMLYIPGLRTHGYKEMNSDWLKSDDEGCGAVNKIKMYHDLLSHVSISYDEDCLTLTFDRRSTVSGLPYTFIWGFHELVINVKKAVTKLFGPTFCDRYMSSNGIAIDGTCSVLLFEKDLLPDQATVTVLGYNCGSIADTTERRGVVTLSIQKDMSLTPTLTKRNRDAGAEAGAEAFDIRFLIVPPDLSSFIPGYSLCSVFDEVRSKIPPELSDSMITELETQNSLPDDADYLPDDADSLCGSLDMISTVSPDSPVTPNDVVEASIEAQNYKDPSSPKMPRREEGGGRSRSRLNIIRGHRKTKRKHHIRKTKRIHMKRKHIRKRSCKR